MEKKIEKWAIMLAHQNGAQVEYKNEGTKGEYKSVIGSDLIVLSGSDYRIVNKTADGLRLDELLDLAEWDMDNINEEHLDFSEFQDIDEWLYWACRTPKFFSNISLKKQAPKMRPMTAQEISMLPRGTCFYLEPSNKEFYNPSIMNIDNEVYLNSIHVSDWRGYTLPTDVLPLEFGLNKFEVEDV